MTAAQRRQIRLHRRALRALDTGRDDGWLYAMSNARRLWILAEVHKRTRGGEPGNTLATFYYWWN